MVPNIMIASIYQIVRSRDLKQSSKFVSVRKQMDITSALARSQQLRMLIEAH